MKKWDGGQSLRGVLEGLPVLGVLGVTVLPAGLKFFENIGANLCNLGTSGYEKWDGKCMLFLPTFKSGMEFTVPAV